ncbi:hypothetical protein Agabi119p4_3269 [Agaricus bisporus var. burnettii]|uniref:Inhibitor of growth protein N-terminal histone-binding domain-containing protein n=1 Tax=Agaricus bisporus var. burnettii TaxID=192524 RepID=A0A8H7F6W5_AGABI|nr:hypothetical protein Agabi119p4_3269 [Agaricus bisporus var. burnettii]
MSTRTRSSTRIRGPQPTDEFQDVRESESDSDEESFNPEEREEEIWDEVREEHYDIIEQLPLTIHRQMTLLRQLDHQAYDYSTSLLPTIKKYIELRRELNTQNGRLVNGSLQAQATPEAAHPTTSKYLRPGAPSTSREMLSHVAWLTEEYLRTSREKVNIAQTVHDSVDRHIRLLDQFIKEQEALLGPEPNRPVMLSMSDLFVPKWSRSTRVSMSPIFDEEQIATDIQQAEVSVHSDRSSRRRSLKNRRHKEKEKEKEKEEPPAPLALRITLPPPHHGMLDDPNEPTWCYCTRVSFGEMIGCDNPECKYEWFHLEMYT